jgi:hypothetical protein
MAWKGFGRPAFNEVDPATRRFLDRLARAVELWATSSGSVTIGDSGLLEVVIDPNGLLVSTADGLSVNGIGTTAQGDLLYVSASNTLTVLNKSATATRYLSNTGTNNNPAWAQVDLTNGVSGTLPVANGGTGSGTAFNNNRILVSAAGAVAEAAALTNGQLLIGSTGAAPVAAGLTGTSNQITVTTGAGSITLSLPQNIHSAATPTFTTLTLSQTTGTAPLTISSTTLVTNLNADLLDGQHGSYYLDSANFTGTNWTDLTDGGASTLHKHDHGGQDGLSDDDHTQYALLAGRSGGQTLIGGTASGNDLTLQSTSNATRGSIYFGTFMEINEATAAAAMGGAVIATDSILSIGGNPTQVTRYKLGFGGDYTNTSGSQAGGIFNLNADPGSSSSASTYGAWGEGGTATGNSSALTSALALVGVRGGVRHRGTGTVTAAITMYAAPVAIPNAGAITTTYGVYIDNQSVSGKTTTTWGLYQDDANDLNYFEGHVGFNVTPTTPIHAKGPDNTTIMTLEFAATQANVTGADTFIDFRSSSGSEGSVAGTGVAGVIAYNTFTGSHFTVVRSSDRAELQPLMLLEIVDGPLPTMRAHKQQRRFQVQKTDRDTGETWVEDRIEEYEAKAADKPHLFRTRICRTRKSKAAIGVFGGTDKEGRDMVLCMGTAPGLVTNTGKDIEIGDLLCSSDVPGHLEIQGDDILRSTTIAKATQTVKWQAGETSRRVNLIFVSG